MAWGVGKVWGNQTLIKHCYIVSLQARTPNIIPIEGLDIRDELTEEQGEPAKDLRTVPLHDVNPQHVIHIGSKLDEAMSQRLINFLWESAVVFTWSPIYM